MHIRTKALAYSLLCLFIAACSNSSGPRYVPRPHVPPSHYTAHDRALDYRDNVIYKQYEHREPCQNYRELPRNAIDWCQPREDEPYKPEIVSTYEIYFDLDKSGIRNDAELTLQRVARDIRRFNPSRVTVTGYTDTSGPADYNKALSRRRAESVVAALENRGIRSEILSEKARGETHLAVKTGDGVVLQENRRVVIDFRR